MNQDRDQQQQSQTGPRQSSDQEKEHKHPSPFKDTAAGTEDDQANTHEEAKLEQERKEAMTERD